MSDMELVKQINNLQRQVNNLIKPEVGRWVDWTPTVTQGVAVTVTVTYARYVVMDNTVIMVARLGVTSAGTGGSNIVIAGLPTAIQVANTDALGVIGTGVISDTGVATYQGALIAAGANDLRVIAHNTSAYIGTSPSFALASEDVISFQAAYERT